MNFIEQAEEFFTQLSPLLTGVLVAAAIFLVIGLRLILKKPPTHLTAFSGEAGSVLVSRKALQELIKQACLLDSSVEAARPVVRVKNSKVSAKVELRLAEPENLKDICERVQERITSLLQKSLSFDQIGEIQIVVKSFTPSESAKPKARALPSKKEAIEPILPASENEEVDEKRV